MYRIRVPAETPRNTVVVGEKACLSLTLSLVRGETNNDKLYEKPGAVFHATSSHLGGFHLPCFGRGNDYDDATQFGFADGKKT